MLSAEKEMAMKVQHLLATAWQGQLVWVKTLQGAGTPTSTQGLLLHFTDASEFQFLIMRTQRPKTCPVKRQRRKFNVATPEE